MVLFLCLILLCSPLFFSVLCEYLPPTLISFPSSFFFLPSFFVSLSPCFPLCLCPFVVLALCGAPSISLCLTCILVFFLYLIVCNSLLLSSWSCLSLWTDYFVLTFACLYIWLVSVFVLFNRPWWTGSALYYAFGIGCTVTFYKTYISFVF